MRTIASCLALALLAACGADGEPIRPVLGVDASNTTGVSVSGEVTIGITN